MQKVKLKDGKKVDPIIIASYMDEEIREKLHGLPNIKTEQQFFRAYCIAHKKKYGEIFFLDSANPVF